MKKHPGIPPLLLRDPFPHPVEVTPDAFVARVLSRLIPEAMRSRPQGIIAQRATNPRWTVDSQASEVCCACSERVWLSALSRVAASDAPTVFICSDCLAARLTVENGEEDV